MKIKEGRATLPIISRDSRQRRRRAEMLACKAVARKNGRCWQDVRADLRSAVA